MKSKKKIIREIYWHDANYPDENNWLSKKDVLKNVDELMIEDIDIEDIKEFKQKIKEGK